MIRLVLSTDQTEDERGLLILKLIISMPAVQGTKILTDQLL